MIKTKMKVGTHVNVTKDDGSIFRSTVKFAPWRLGHGQWVIGINGIAGGYDLNRVEKIAENPCALCEGNKKIGTADPITRTGLKLVTCTRCEGTGEEPK